MTAWLFTWLWQGLVLACAMGATLRLLNRLNAATRYCIWWFTLAALGSLGSWSSSSAAHLPAVLEVGRTHLILIPSAPEAWLTILFGVWLAIALVLLVRIVPGVRAVFRLRDRCTDFPRGVEAQLPLWLEAQERGRSWRPARLMLCDAVRGATVLGFHCPYIAVPPSLLNTLTREELDQIVLHEHAHIQRWDDWTRLAQTLLQSALWIHPATAVIGRGLDLEREVACDEWVVARTGRPKAFARCLTRAAEIRGRMGIDLLLGPALFTRRCDLVDRVNRLLAVRGRTRRSISVVGAAAGACVLMMAILQLRAIPPVGELGEIAPDTVRLSAVARSNHASFGETRRSLGEGWKPDTTYVLAEAPMVRDEPSNLTNPRTDAPIAPDEPSAPHAPVAPVAPDLAGRSFDGHYPVSEPPVRAPENRAPWQLAGAVGVEIGSSARKTSVGVANIFRRAGVSLARRF